MAMSVHFMLSASLRPYPSSSVVNFLHPSKVECSGFLDGGMNGSGGTYRRPLFNSHNVACNSKQSFSIDGEYEVSSSSITQEAESFLLNAVNMSFFERLNLAWKLIFPSPASKRKSNANIAKQRLQMILFSDRCAVSDEAKQKIVSNIVGALSDFVEIESQDKVELSVSTDAALGTIYSVTVPVRRVKPQYQEDDETGTITNIEYKDSGETSDSVDVKFDFYVPDENEFRF
ncbi:cell division topological specificity factor homolog, chloroplastic-like [Apium graveolens]|uniref:cell division topological specificity factor homolog, chloroplastic-like n=1 Tax=Apium graveolens TaxID=4045 RepID=UPI003D7AC168